MSDIAASGKATNSQQVNSRPPSMLFSPFKIRELELRNRFVFQPHFTALGHIDGQPSDDLAAYHEERARGGVGDRKSTRLNSSHG